MYFDDIVKDKKEENSSDSSMSASDQESDDSSISDSNHNYNNDHSSISIQKIIDSKHESRIKDLNFKGSLEGFFGNYPDKERK